MRIVAARSRRQRHRAPTLSNEPYWNFGCALQSERRGAGRRSRRSRARPHRRPRRHARGASTRHREAAPGQGSLDAVPSARRARSTPRSAVDGIAKAQDWRACLDSTRRRTTASSRRFRASPSRPSARPPDVAAAIAGRGRRPAHAQGPRQGRRWAAPPAAVEAYRKAPTPNVIVLEIADDRAGAPRRPRQPRRGLRRRHEGRGHRPCQRRAALPRADHAAASANTSSRRWRRSTSSRRLGPVLARRAPSRSGAPSRSSAPRAASARRPSRTISPGRSRASLRRSTVIVDLDIAFGTAGLDFNQDPPQGIAEAVFAPGPARRAISSTACCRNAATI